MELEKVIYGRRSIRKYVKDVVIPEEDIKKILTSAMVAPSACNTRPWEFIVVENQEVKQKLVEAHPHARMILDASICILVVARDDLQKGVCSGYYPQDCGAATENILLTSYDLGYGSCWCGVYPNEDRVNKIKDILNIEVGIPFNIIAIGKADETPMMKGKYEEHKVKYIK